MVKGKQKHRVMCFMNSSSFSISPCLSGRQRQCLRLLPTSVLESGDLKNQAIKVQDTEGASKFTYSSLGRTVYLCVAIKNRVIVYEIGSLKNKYEKKKASLLLCFCDSYSLRPPL